MPNNDTKTIFDGMVKSFTDILNLLTAAGNAFRDDGHPDFSVDILHRQFELSIQCALLAVSLADGKISKAEIAAIASLGVHADLMEMLSDEETEFKWDELPAQSPYIISKFQLNIERNLEKLLDDFCLFLVLYKETRPEDEVDPFMTSFLTDCRELAQGLAEIDGNRDENEQYVLEDKIKSYYLEGMLRVLEKISADDDGNRRPQA